MKQLPLAIGADAPEQGFGNFVAGANVAAAAHLAALGEHAAPVYLWGPPGSGKTHLLRAVTGQVQARGGQAAWFSSRDPLPWPHDERRALLVLDGCDLFDAENSPRLKGRMTRVIQDDWDGADRQSWLAVSPVGANRSDDGSSLPVTVVTEWNFELD